MMRTRRLGAIGAMMGVGIGLAACQSGGGTTPTGTAATTSAPPTTTAPSVPGEPVGDRLREQIAGNTLSGSAWCSYYGADGSLTRAAGGAVQAGTWTVDGRFVCESVGGGASACYTIDFLPLGGANVTPATGSSIPAQSVQVSAGNQCG